MDESLLEIVFEEEVRKEVSSGEFKDAPTHRLQRRFAEYYEAQKRKWCSLKEFSIGFNPIEKFKDIPAIFTISLYPEYIVIGPMEKEGVKHQYTDVIKALLGYINRNLIHPYLLDLLDRGEYAFYDNHIVVEITDYREVETTSSRVLLKGTFAGMSYTPALLHATKTEDADEAALIAKTAVVCLDPSPEVFEVMKAHDYNLKKLDDVVIEQPPRRKIHIGSIIKEYKRVQESLKREVFPGFERLGNVRIYRTAKFIGGGVHYSINVLVNSDHIEVVFRQGEVINTAIGGYITKRKFTSTTQVDMYIDSVKRLLEVYHKDLKCICDISANPRKPKSFASPPQSTTPKEVYRRSSAAMPSSPVLGSGAPRLSGSSLPSTSSLGVHGLHPHTIRHVPLGSSIISPGAHGSAPYASTPYSGNRVGYGFSQPPSVHGSVHESVPYPQRERPSLQGPGERAARHSRGENGHKSLMNPPQPQKRSPWTPKKEEFDDFNFDYVNKKFI
ncbi:hypothetical protein NECID01_0456 [Nematocida sp. AWRm77]|nr:hypothetical protein NECID01_0456 [Nematocida sp. AWRm77]